MRHLIVLLSVVFSLCSFAQTLNPVQWKASYSKLQGQEGEIIVSAQIENGWHTYSQRPTDAGPIPTSFTFTPGNNCELVGVTAESDAHEEFVPAFDAKIFVFTGKAEFRQKIRVNSAKPFTLPLKVEYMSCNDKMCLPPKTVDLSVRIE
jgi:DsbC/DsbD-like thiol-disulfide interchange protein